MAEELKNRSFRISDETTEKFRQLCGGFDNQNVALNALISAYEVQQAKTIITDRQTDINDYDTHLQALQRAFLHSLEVNENAENRIRQEFQHQIDSKNAEISGLRESVKKAEQAEKATKEQAKITVAECDERTKQAEKTIDSLHKELDDVRKQSVELSESLTAVKSQVVDKQEIIKNLNQQLTNAKIMTEKAESAENELKQVKEKLSEIEKRYESEVKELKQQLASQRTNAEQSAKVAERLAEADKREAIASLKEAHVAELDELRRKIQALTEENFNLKSQKKSD